jgi:hypothetical protein
MADTGYTRKRKTLSDLDKNSPVFRYVAGVGERAMDSLTRHPKHLERLYMIVYGVTSLANIFPLNYHFLVQRLTKDIAIEDALRPKISEAVAQADPVVLGLPILSLEFRNYFDEIVCESYNGAARTLRMILETSMSIADFCLDSERLKAEDIVTGLSHGELPQEVLLLNLPAPALAERLRYQERHRSFVSFSRLFDMVKRTLRFANGLDVVKLWKELSEYSHFSSRPYKHAIQQFGGQGASESLFQQLYDYALNVVDVAFFLLIQSEAYYLSTEVNALVNEIGHWVSPPIATNLMIEMPIVREKEFLETKKMYFFNSYPLIETLDKQIRKSRLEIR